MSLVVTWGQLTKTIPASIWCATIILAQRSGGKGRTKGKDTVVIPFSAQLKNAKNILPSTQVYAQVEQIERVES